MSAHGHRDDMSRLVHDLRTPLAIVAGFAELLERRGDQLTPEQQAEYLTRIRESAARMGELLDDVG
jgi:two-component system OmpR family sensor kinase